ncbi:UEV-domain-containing protein [Pluteus cervinus]|uniref:UEV-domain-containing protein n=1 Tax=Pluteus cervinus TaxID=181527 RepID=A0ACD3BEF0_9AGAR|nr:UEV-domain-containing protein [Pluteus cervinus]
MASADSLTTKWLRQNSLAYPDRDRVCADIDHVLAAFQNIRPKSDIYTYDDGRTQLLLCLHGLLPILYRNASYNIPIAIWITRDYPRQPPIVYVVPTGEMLVKPGNHVDVSGKSNIEYMQNWERKSEGCHLVALFEALQHQFSNDPPLYAKPRNAPSTQSPPPSLANPRYAAKPPPPLPQTASSPHAQPPDRPPLPPKPNPSADQIHAQPSALQSISSHVAINSQAERSTSQPPSYKAPPIQQARVDSPALPLGLARAVSGNPTSPPPPPPPPLAPPKPVDYGGPLGIHTIRSPQLIAPSPLPPPSLPPPPPPPPAPFAPQVPHQPQSQQPYYLQHANAGTSYTQSPPPPPPDPVLRVAIPAPNLMDEEPPPSEFTNTIPTDQPSSAPLPPRPPNPELLQLHAQVHDKISLELASLSQAMSLDAERLRAIQSDLLAGEPAIRDEMARLEAVRDVCRNVGHRMRGAVEAAEANVAELRRKGDPEVDELVCSTTIVHTQLVDLVADDNAIEDTIYHLHRALNSGRIDLERFLRTTRALAEEQFMKRALIEKIRLGMPSSEMEPNWWS